MSSSQYAGRVRVRGCALVVKENKLLMVSQSVPTRNHTVWLAPGGEVELGESAGEAAKRETAEETGLIINPLKLAAVNEFAEPPFHAVELYFLSEIVGGTLKAGHDPEHSEDDQQVIKTAFISLDRLKDLRVVPEFLKGTREIVESAGEGKVLHFSMSAD